MLCQDIIKEIIPFLAGDLSAMLALRGADRTWNKCVMEDFKSWCTVMNTNLPFTRSPLFTQNDDPFDFLMKWGKTIVNPVNAPSWSVSTNLDDLLLIIQTTCLLRNKIVYSCLGEVIIKEVSYEGRTHIKLRASNQWEYSTKFMTLDLDESAGRHMFDILATKSPIKSRIVLMHKNTNELYMLLNEDRRTSGIENPDPQWNLILSKNTFVVHQGLNWVPISDYCPIPRGFCFFCKYLLFF